MKNRRGINKMQRLRYIKTKQRNPRNPHHNPLLLRRRPPKHARILNLLYKSQPNQQKTHLSEPTQETCPRCMARSPQQQPLPTPAQSPTPHDVPHHRALVHPPRTPHGLPHRLLQRRRCHLPPLSLRPLLPHPREKSRLPPILPEAVLSPRRRPLTLQAPLALPPSYEYFPLLVASARFADR